MLDSASIEKNYASSRERYAGLGIDTEKALAALGRIPISLHCRRETGGTDAGPRKDPELREDLHEAFRLIPGPHRLGLRAVHAESPGASVERNALEPSHFRGWVEWAKQEGLKLDFSASCYGRPQAASGFTLSHPDKDVRRFWIEHVRRCRKISASIGRELKAPCIHTLYVPDGLRGRRPFRPMGAASSPQRVPRRGLRRRAQPDPDEGRPGKPAGRERGSRGLFPGVLHGICHEPGKAPQPEPRSGSPRLVGGRRDLGAPSIFRRSRGPLLRGRPVGRRPRRPAR